MGPCAPGGAERRASGALGAGAAVGPEAGGQSVELPERARDPRICELRAGFHSLVLINGWKFC